MKNPYLRNLNKIEFAVTYRCTGMCKHCSEGEHASRREEIDPQIAKDAVRKIVSEYAVQTVMAFGGEPLLHTDAVYAIISAAKELGVPKRQIITNGYFSTDKAKISEVLDKLSLCGVNDLLLSVDAFHQETIPIDVVRCFAEEIKKRGIPMRLQPAWLCGATAENRYNELTRKVLAAFSDLEIALGEGNVVFPAGNALKYLGEYFTEIRPENPYEENPEDIRCVSFSPNGDVLDGNVYRSDILDIMKNYTPKR